MNDLRKIFRNETLTQNMSYEQRIEATLSLLYEDYDGCESCGDLKLKKCLEPIIHWYEDLYIDEREDYVWKRDSEGNYSLIKL